jgi:hypothetical protein
MDFAEILLNLYALFSLFCVILSCTLDRTRQCELARKKCAEMGDYGGFDRASSDLASVNEVC